MEIGSGHVYRCLTLANRLSERGARTRFICRNLPGHLGDKIVSARHELVLLETDKPFCGSLEVDWLADADQTVNSIDNDGELTVVVDHYGIDSRWENRVGLHASRIFALDDLANRPHSADLLLDQNLGRSALEYDGLLAPGTRTLIGPKFALLRPEIRAARSDSLRRRRHPASRRLLVTMGGMDSRNLSEVILRSISSMKVRSSELDVTIVMGARSNALGEVKRAAAAAGFSCKVLYDIPNMGEIIAESDLLISAAGSTVLEALCLGIPSLFFPVADNQFVISSALENAQCAVQSIPEEVATAVPAFIERAQADTAWLIRLSAAAASLVDGLGAERVVRILEK